MSRRRFSDPRDATFASTLNFWEQLAVQDKETPHPKRVHSKRRTSLTPSRKSSKKEEVKLQQPSEEDYEEKVFSSEDELEIVEPRQEARKIVKRGSLQTRLAMFEQRHTIDVPARTPVQRKPRKAQPIVEELEPLQEIQEAVDEQEKSVENSISDENEEDPIPDKQDGSLEVLDEGNELEESDDADDENMNFSEEEKQSISDNDFDEANSNEDGKENVDAEVNMDYNLKDEEHSFVTMKGTPDAIDNSAGSSMKDIRNQFESRSKTDETYETRVFIKKPEVRRRGLAVGDVVEEDRDSIAAIKIEDVSQLEEPEFEEKQLLSKGIDTIPETNLEESEEGYEEEKEVDREEDRLAVLEEIIVTEETYVKNLNTLITEFAHPLKSNGSEYGVSLAQASVLFSNVEMIAMFHSQFSDELSSSPELVGEKFLRFADFFKIYTEYLNSYARALETLNSVRNNKKFKKFLSTRNTRTPLPSLLIMPVQRVPRYELLLRELVKYTPESSDQYEALYGAYEKVQNVTQHINDMRRRADNCSKLFEIQAKIKGKINFLLIAPDRHLIREQSLKLVGISKSNKRMSLKKEKSHKLFVFSDCLLIVSENNNYKGVIMFKEIDVSESDLTASFTSSFQDAYTYEFPNSHVMEDFFTDFSQALEMYQNSLNRD